MNTARPACALLALLLAGCSTYRTPGAGVNLGDFSRADADIGEVMKREPAAAFPARVAIARVEAPGYTTRGASCFGKGRLCLVTAHEVETDQDFAQLAGMPQVAAAAPLGRMLIPGELKTMKDLRLGAASLRADLLLVYSIDTRFHVESTDIGPLALMSLGFLPNKKAHVTATASAALIDVRSGFVYGVAESTATEEQRASVWSTESAIDDSRLKAERGAFRGLLSEYDKLWRGVVREHATADGEQLTDRG
ncbi:MAG: hypothetical protein AUH10_13135 [Gammaproteobacteria bacterium 13_2_20CM_66_19]|nr:MAG: hypothetical protein AUH10_13135 [Gammaproteobacteria bacterium 13_2_20CM_66_19]